jgi:arylsulfatase A
MTRRQLLARSIFARAPKRPNLVLFLADDLGWADLACYGHRFHETPNLDALARAGTRFTNAYAAAPICAPTHASILTGKHPARLHLTGQPSYYGDPPIRKLLHPPFRKTLPVEEPSIARQLAGAGYKCAFFGKWTVGNTPEQYGFAVYGDGPAVKLAALAEQFIGRHGKNPFFLYVASNEVHVPLESKAPARLVDKYRAKLGAEDPRAVYAAVVEEMDACLGGIVSTLEKTKLLDNTVIVFTSDNGGFSGATSNAPLRDGKASLYEGGIRVPLIVRGPGILRPGSTCSEPVIATDLYSTLQELAGLCPDGLDGISIEPLLRGAKAPARTLYWHWPHYRRSDPGVHASPSSAIRSGDFKLIEFYEDGHAGLYNLTRDISETADLLSTMPAVAQSLRQNLRAWLASIGAQMPRPNPAYDPVKDPGRAQRSAV